jgi:hypothetical protein
VAGDALKQLPSHRAGTRPGRKVLIRADSAGCTHEFLDWIVAQRLSYSVGSPARRFRPDPAADPEAGLDTGDRRRRPVHDGAWVADVTALVNLSKWPAGMRVIVRKQRPHPGAQLRLNDVDGMRVTAFATNTARGATRRSRTAPSPSSQRRRPHPLRQRHRTQEPSTARLRPEPDLVCHRRPGLRTHHLDAATRLHRYRRHRPSSSSVGTQTPTPTTVLHRRQGSPEPAAAPSFTSPQRCLDPPCYTPASPDSAPSPHPVETPHPPLQPETNPGPWNRRPPETTLGPLSYPTTRINPERRPPGRVRRLRRSHEDPG